MFKLNFEIPISEKKINLQDQIYLIGSCFSDEVGSQLNTNKFRALSNPFGTLYNPPSIFKLLRDQASEDNLVESQGVHYHWDCHGQICGLSKTDTAQTFEDAQHASKRKLKEAKWLVITLGTATVYRLKDTNEIVANCHKIPSDQFSKELLSSDDIISDFKKTLTHLNEANPNLKIILTVSPVRHVKDGLIENNLSKSILLRAVHQLVSDHSQVHYFPSYEIMIDELRDYRFYKKDMIHPSDEAVEYIWNQFAQTYFDEQTINFLEQWNKFRSALHHKPFLPNSSKHQQFLKNTLNQLEKMNDLVDVGVERELLKQQLL